MVSNWLNTFYRSKNHSECDPNYIVAMLLWVIFVVRTLSFILIRVIFSFCYSYCSWHEWPFSLMPSILYLSTMWKVDQVWCIFPLKCHTMGWCLQPTDSLTICGGLKWPWFMCPGNDYDQSFSTGTQCHPIHIYTSVRHLDSHWLKWQSTFTSKTCDPKHCMT